jgi:uncharacterized coiled-coil protein SlyX
MSSRTLDLIVKHWIGELPQSEGSVRLSFVVETFCAENDAIIADLQQQLAEADRQIDLLRDALEYHISQTRPIDRSAQALAATGKRGE